MTRLMDRYILKEIVAPFLLGLLVLTLLMLLHQLFQLTEWVVDKGVRFTSVAALFVNLLPSFFLLTIPMATAFAVLIAFNRLALDKEGLAFHACGVSFLRLLRPVLAFALIAAAMTWMMGLLSRDERSIKSAGLRILKERMGVGIAAGQFTEFLPGFMVYTISVPSPSEMRHVFIYDGRSENHPRIVVAQRGAFLNGPEGEEIQLHDGMLRTDHQRDDHQITFAGYSLRIKAELTTSDSPSSLSTEETNRRLLELYKKYTLAAAAFLFAFISVPLGFLAGKVGRAGILLGLGLILFYYVLTLACDALLAYGLSPLLAAALPSCVLLFVTLFLLRFHANQSLSY